ncbi:Nucleotide-Binding Oligomerization Domain-Containing Protein 1 [Manis pentadactyla]|nr:Nucleotide-Binding Oligomerization Domain-Containing Protein 1 [Manis pentadactyla]
MDKQGSGEMEVTPSEPHSHIQLLKTSQELLVTHIHNTRCLLDNLLENDYFSAEDAEIVCACPTQPDKVDLSSLISLKSYFSTEPSAQHVDIRCLRSSNQRGNMDCDKEHNDQHKVGCLVISL